MPNPPGIWYNVREGKSEHESKTDAHACMRRPGAIHENAPASPGSRRLSGLVLRLSGLLPERNMYMMPEQLKLFKTGRTGQKPL